MPGTPTTKYALPTLAGTDLVSDMDEYSVSLAAALDTKLAPSDQGSFASRPTSTGVNPGKIGRTYYAPDRKTLYRDNGNGWDIVGPRQSFATASLPGAFAVTSSNPATELDTGMRCTLPAVVGDVIDADLNLFVSGASGSGPTQNIFAVHFIILDNANVAVRGFPSRSGAFPPIFRVAGFTGSIEASASYRLQAGDIRPDGTVRVSIGVHTGGAQAVIGTATQDRTISLKNLGQMA
jgi:hypothetical protein